MTLLVMAGVLALAYRFRPPPVRVVSAAPARRPGRRNEPLALVAVGLGFALGPGIGVGAAGLVLAAPRLRRHRAAARQRAAVEAQLPEVVDLLALAVGAGLTVHQALHAVARRTAGPFGAALTDALTEVARGRRLADAVDGLPSKAGDAVRPLASALAACERYGAPVRESLERLALETRDRQRRRAEQAARRVPVLLLFPLVLCILPAFALLAVAPLFADAASVLRL